MFSCDFGAGRNVILTATAEPMDGEQNRETLKHLAGEAERRNKLLERVSEGLRNYPGSELVYAADQFVIVAPRVDLRRQDIGDERTVIAGYHWFTDWGRDTMISLEGLTLVREAPRGTRDSEDVRATRSRWADPEHVSGRRDRRGFTTRRTRRCGSSMP